MKVKLRTQSRAVHRVREFEESVETVEQAIRRFVPDSMSQYRLMISLEKSLERDDRGRVQFKTYAIAWRRRVVRELLKSLTQTEIAEKLGVPVATVQNDVRWLYENRGKKI